MGSNKRDKEFKNKKGNYYNNNNKKSNYYNSNRNNNNYPPQENTDENTFNRPTFTNSTKKEINNDKEYDAPKGNMNKYNNYNNNYSYSNRDNRERDDKNPQIYNTNSNYSNQNWQYQNQRNDYNNNDQKYSYNKSNNNYNKEEGQFEKKNYTGIGNLLKNISEENAKIKAPKDYNNIEKKYSYPKEYNNNNNNNNELSTNQTEEAKKVDEPKLMFINSKKNEETSEGKENFVALEQKGDLFLEKFKKMNIEDNSKPQIEYSNNASKNKKPYDYEHKYDYKNNYDNNYYEYNDANNNKKYNNEEKKESNPQIYEQKKIITKKDQQKSDDLFKKVEIKFESKARSLKEMFSNK